MTSNQTDLRPDLAQVFLPLHKLAFGVAIGSAAALLVFAVTADALLRDVNPRPNLELLAQYFSGYTVSWTGALIGAVWAWFSGFVMGWFWAFSRNFVLAIRILILRSRADLAQTRDFLDHI